MADFEDLNDIEPLSDFSSLKEYLNKEFGLVVDRVSGNDIYGKIDTTEVSAENIANGSLEIHDDGIFLITPDGVRHQGFMYKKEYFVKRFGKPRYHVCNCEVLQDFQDRKRFDKYFWSQDTIVPVINMDDNYTQIEIEDLPLCSKCKALLNSGASAIFSTKTSTTDFINHLKEQGLIGSGSNSGPVDVDLFGYTRDWPEISARVRAERNYTCESCGIDLSSLMYTRFLHVHHKSGDKLDNSDNNLRCLCIRCHSRVDDNHSKNLSTGSSGKDLDDFNHLFPEDPQKKDPPKEDSYDLTSLDNLKLKNYLDILDDNYNVGKSKLRLDSDDDLFDIPF